MGAAAEDYFGVYGNGVGYGEGVAGTMAPAGYEYAPGSTATFFLMLLLTDSDDRFVASVTDKDHGSELVGLWIKVADHLAFQLGEPTGTLDDHWFFDLEENSLGWSDGGSYEVSLWDKRPPLAPAPPRRLWTSTLGAASGGYGNLGSGVGYGRGRAGSLEPGSYQPPAGCNGETAVFNRIVLLPEGDDKVAGADRVYVAMAGGSAQASCLVGLGLWLKVADHLAFELVEPTDARGDRWFFEIPEGGLDWSAGNDYEVSLWDKRPPLSEPPPRKLWTSTLGAASDDYGNLGAGVGYGLGGAGSLAPDSYQPPAGCNGETVAFARILLVPDGVDKVAGADRVYVAMAGGSAQASCLVGLGLWLKVADHLAFELVEPTDARGDRWFFEIPEGGLDWSAGNDYEVSLWDKQPELAPAPPRQLWSTTMTAGFEQFQTEGLGYGYGEGGYGSLSDNTYEFESGSVATLRTLVLFRTGDDTLRLVMDNSSTLNGLWLRVSDSLAVQLSSVSGNTREWTLVEGSLSWADGDSVAVSLWDKDPTSG